jgi:hypothetical protein
MGHALASNTIHRWSNTRASTHLRLSKQTSNTPSKAHRRRRSQAKEHAKHALCLALDQNSNPDFSGGDNGLVRLQAAAALELLPARHHSSLRRCKERDRINSKKHNAQQVKLPFRAAVPRCPCFFHMQGTGAGL